eukprot:2109257-Pleurochrysis_carterae.AAC.2
MAEQHKQVHHHVGEVAERSDQEESRAGDAPRRSPLVDAAVPVVVRHVQHHARASDDDKDTEHA